MNDQRRTRRVQDRTSKRALWSQFDEVCGEKNAECVYTAADPSDLCRACGAFTVINEDGFPTCPEPSCGLMETSVLDRSAEWRFQGDEPGGTDQTRCGMPINPLLKESSYGCRVLVSSGASWQMRKIKRYTEWQSMPYKEKSHYDEFQRISIHADQAGISRAIVDDALRMHKQISGHRTFRGLNRDGIIAASIYVAARMNGYPRTSKEIAHMFNLDYSSATRGCKNAVDIMNEVENDLHDNEKTSLCETRPDDFIARYGCKAGLTEELTRLATFVAYRIREGGLVQENTPHAIAAGIVYFVAQFGGLELSKKTMNAISGISEVTINKCFKKLNDLHDTLIPAAMKSKYPGIR